MTAVLVCRAVHTWPGPEGLPPGAPAAPSGGRRAMGPAVQGRETAADPGACEPGGAGQRCRSLTWLSDTSLCVVLCFGVLTCVEHGCHFACLVAPLGRHSLFADIDVPVPYVCHVANVLQGKRHPSSYPCAVVICSLLLLFLLSSVHHSGFVGR